MPVLLLSKAIGHSPTQILGPQDHTKRNPSLCFPKSYVNSYHLFGLACSVSGSSEAGKDRRIIPHYPQFVNEEEKVQRSYVIYLSHVIKRHIGDRKPGLSNSPDSPVLYATIAFTFTVW